MSWSLRLEILKISVSSQNYDKGVSEMQKTLRDLHRVIREKQEANEALTQELEELNVSVNERRHIHEVNGEFVGQCRGIFEYSWSGAGENGDGVNIPSFRRISLAPSNLLGKISRLPGCLASSV